MAERLMGIETEYALVSLWSERSYFESGSAADLLMAAARERLVQLPDHAGGGVFLENGARFYVDCGGHPEYCTPECSNPDDVVRHVIAGERIMYELACEVRQAEREDLALFKTNVDYAGSLTTWGCHESYSCRLPPDSVAEALIPHLATRVIYAGAGGFDPIGSQGINFVVSPRALNINVISSGSSTSDRGIFHLKNEPLGAGGYYRIHVISGESLCSEYATWLKVGTTALVVALAEAGACPLGEVDLLYPLEAFHAAACDLTCKAKLSLRRGGTTSAIEIQRKYLEYAEVFATEEFMPPWAGLVCERWREVLDRLESGPEAVETTLDWAIKLKLYRAHADRRGVDWTKLTMWNRIITELMSALAQTEFADSSVSVDLLLSETSPVKRAVGLLQSEVDSYGLDWNDLNAVLALRSELLELDMRYSQLGERSLFGALDRSGVLDHRVPSVGAVDEAMREPPGSGRARVRGLAIRRLAREGGAYTSDWDGISNHTNAKIMDLSNPFETEERWFPSLEGPDRSWDAENFPWRASQTRSQRTGHRPTEDSR